MTKRLAEYSRATISMYRARQHCRRPRKLRVGGGSYFEMLNDFLGPPKKYVYGCPSNRATPTWRYMRRRICGGSPTRLFAGPGGSISATWRFWVIVQVVSLPFWMSLLMTVVRYSNVWGGCWLLVLWALNTKSPPVRSKNATYTNQGMATWQVGRGRLVVRSWETIQSALGDY